MTWAARIGAGAYSGSTAREGVRDDPKLGGRPGEWIGGALVPVALGVGWLVRRRRT